MFNTTKLMRERDALKEEIADLKLEKKISEEDIKHMVRIQTERQAIELEKTKMQMLRENEAEITRVKDEYRNKLEARLEVEVSNMKEMYSEILQRLPSVGVRLKGEV